jgi:hypothetical protein
MNGGEPAAVREALDELDQYLADSLPPLLVAESMKVLISCPPQVLARHLVASSEGKGMPGDAADWLAKSLGRLERLADLQLLKRNEFNRFMGGFEPVLVASCPIDARMKLRTLLRQLERGRVDDSSPAHADPRATGWLGQSEGPGQAGDNMMRHLLPLLNRLAETIAQAKSGSGGASQETVSQLVAVVTRTAQTAQQLEERLERLKGLGLDTDVPAILKVLGQSLPNWAVVTPSRISQTLGSTGEPSPKYSDTRLQAMQRIVELAKLPEENAARFGQMLETAVEQFNQGGLGRAVSILESANQLVLDRKVDTVKSRPLWEKAQEKIQWQRFADCLADPVQHRMVQGFISFFPAFSPSLLLTRLKRERDRTTRRMLVSLLQVQGNDSRSEALQRLEVILGSVRNDQPPDWEYVRDLLVLICSYQAGEMSRSDDKLEVLIGLAEVPLPLPVFRELVRYATQLEPAKSVDLLTTLLRQPALQSNRLESAGEGTGFQWSTGLEQILCGLAAVQSAQARRLVLNHCLQQDGAPGPVTSPVGVFGATDLSEDAEAVSRLLAALKQVLRRRWFRFFGRRKERAALDLVKALSGTSTHQVRTFLADLGRRFPNHSFGIAAGQASGGVNRTSAAAEDLKRPVEDRPPDNVPDQPGDTPATVPPADEVFLEGQLESFDLPTLIQHLANCRSSGVLELLNPGGRVYGTLMLAAGQIRRCAVGCLAGKEAFYLLLEKPMLGRFRMVRPAAGAPASELEAAHSEPPLPMMAMLLEGMRRYDEYRQSCLLVSDEVVLVPTGKKRSLPEDEDDPELASSLWEMVQSGGAAKRCEDEIATDPFRVRRLLAHWVGEGALEAKA